MDKSKRDLRGIIASAAFAVIGGLAIYYSQEFSPLGAVFPRTIAAAMIVLCAVYIAVALLQPIDIEKPEPGSAPRRIALAITMLGWALLLEPLGFLLTSIVCFTAALVIANYDRWTPRLAVVYAGIGILVLGTLYGLFSYVLQVPFPKGILL
jgi:putative tricarboxylic transport membrane protein